MNDREEIDQSQILCVYRGHTCYIYHPKDNLSCMLEPESGEEMPQI